MMTEALSLLVLLPQFASTFYMVGLVWFVHRIHHPKFASVGSKQISVYQRDKVWFTSAVAAWPARAVDRLSCVGRSLDVRQLRRAVLISITCLGNLSQPALGNTSQSYEFKVFLGEQEIGRQRFDVSSEGEQTDVRVDAQFEVKFFYITFYTYRHTNSEKWESACLREIRSHTDDNGDAYFVNGTFESGQLQVQTQTGNWSGDDCIKTFAYWDPEWITGDRLLNSQTGELLPVSIRSMGEETISVQGIPTRTTRRRIITDDFTVDLWYAKNGRWVALQSTTTNGDSLRYVLQ